MLKLGDKIAVKVGRKCLLWPMCHARIPLTKRQNRHYCCETHRKYGRLIYKALIREKNRPKRIEEEYARIEHITILKKSESQV